jgi:hypothetical protein
LGSRARNAQSQWPRREMNGLLHFHVYIFAVAL